jgi:hypothetical protein
VSEIPGQQIGVVVIFDSGETHVLQWGHPAIAIIADVSADSGENKPSNEESASG